MIPIVNEIGQMYRRTPGVAVLHFTGAILAWFLPDDILTMVPAIKVITDIASSIFPLIKVASARSSFPQVTEVYFSLLLLAAPYRLYGWLRILLAGKEKAEANFRTQWIKSILFLLEPLAKLKT